MFKVFVKISNAEYKTYCHNYNIEFVPDMLESFHILAHFYPYVYEKITPD